MKRTNPKVAQLVSEKLGQVLPTVHHVIDESVIVARKFFEDKESKIDNYLFPSLVRYEAKQLLELPEFKKIGYHFVSLSNNGLYLIYKYEDCYYKIRIRKADEFGELPVQNLSKTLKVFYQNQHPLFPVVEFKFGRFLLPEMNLVIVWEVDKNFTLQSVHLVCPKNEFGEVHFADKIEHAVTSIICIADFDDQADELEDIDILPLKKRKIN